MKTIYELVQNFIFNDTAYILVPPCGSVIMAGELRMTSGTVPF
jgi:hypothetical protein